MQESIGGISITLIVIVLILLFTGIITLTINRSNAIAVKSQIIDIIEDNDGFDMNAVASFGTECDGDEVLCDILNQLDTLAYRQTGICDEDANGYSRTGAQGSGNRNGANFCIKKISTNGGTNRSSDVNRNYYEVTVFYSVDLPVIKQLFRFKLKGQTRLLYS